MTTIELAIARHDERTAALEEYQEKQNGALLRLEQKIERLEEKVDRLQTWLLTTATSALISLGLLVLNLLGR